MVRVILSLGSNAGDRAGHLGRGVALLRHRLQPSDLRVSSVYLTSPLPPAAGPPFLNMAVSFDWQGRPEYLLDLTEEIEREVGRTSKRDSAPRPLDIDIVAFGRRTLSRRRLRLPHPECSRRLFVLLPVREIEPAFRPPGAGDLDSRIAWLRSHEPWQEVVLLKPFSEVMNEVLH